MAPGLKEKEKDSQAAKRIKDNTRCPCNIPPTPTENLLRVHPAFHGPKKIEAKEKSPHTHGDDNEFRKIIDEVNETIRKAHEDRMRATERENKYMKDKLRRDIEEQKIQLEHIRRLYCE